ncbi:Mitochondrial inner membrane protein OXA1L [Ooceraea biroi]|uniref:Mitochondrial inner membrane protein OXA1L n=1 Tax=Ooceraea biroi TaxID=2015173 RepID=A0A026WF36_OOCBI|nr:Mitochondrial inner membrane protein OXA1L [Ooceraea biroi]
MRAATVACRQAFSKANVVSQEVIAYRYIHLVRQVRQIPRSSLLDLHRNCRVVGIPLVRYASTNETAPSTAPPETTPSQSTAPEAIPQAAPEISPYDEIPDAPTPIVQEIVENIVKLHSNGEPTFESMGLGCNYTPVGLIQKSLEFLHIHCDLPWWTTIVIGTLCVRLLMFPIVVIAQKNMIKFNNHMPKIKQLQEKMSEARNSGDYVESSRAASDLMHYTKNNDISFGKNILMPIVQAPVFISFFLALRKMANTPVESLKEGGFWWVTDLTLHDPYYIMPIATSVTMYITIEVGADGANLRAMGLMRYVIRVAPFVVLPFMIHFPGTIVTYWLSTNVISLAQAHFLKIPYIRKKLNMPILNTKTAAEVKKSDKGFIAEFKEAWTNMKISKDMDNRQRVDAIQFSRAGKGPLLKTFKYDPTKRKESAVYAKKR